VTIHDWTGLISVSIWPVTVLIVAIVLRTELTRLIGRMREFAGSGNVKFVFDPQKWNI